MFATGTYHPSGICNRLLKLDFELEERVRRRKRDFTVVHIDQGSQLNNPMPRKLKIQSYPKSRNEELYALCPVRIWTHLN